MLAEYVRKAASLAVTHECTHQCHEDSHRQIHEGTLYAYGPAPQGYRAKLSAFAKRYGYGVTFGSPLPTDLNGEGCSGFTVGYVPPENRWEYPGVEPFHIYLQQGLSPATEFLVACHELTHMLLHSARNEHDLLEAAAKRRGRQESIDEETQAHVAAVAVAKQMGVKIRRSALCFLADRAKVRRPSKSDERAALKAAQVITGALNTQSYAMAA